MEELNAEYQKPYEGIVHPEMAKDIEAAFPHEYRNYKKELRDRKIQFYDSTKNGTLRYQIVPMSGHKFVPGREPRHRNTEADWFSFFTVHGEFTQSLEKVYQEIGEKAVIQLRGKKLLKHLLKYLGTIALYKQGAEVAKAQQEQEKDATG